MNFLESRRYQPVYDIAKQILAGSPTDVNILDLMRLCDVEHPTSPQQISGENCMTALQIYCVLEAEKRILEGDTIAEAYAFFEEIGYPRDLLLRSLELKLERYEALILN